MARFTVIEVPDDSAENIEQLGTKPKFWFRHPEYGWSLCKLVRPNTGEDWSEKVAAEIAESIGLPHARYELGRYEKKRCVVSPKFLPEVCVLIHGNEFLGQTNPSYGNINVSRFRATAHTLEAVWDVLDQTDCELPLEWSPPHGIRTPMDVFVGYLLLDALVGNTDRHHENWAIVEAPEDAAGRRHLAPTFDHASCLGCHVTDEHRKSRLATKDAHFTPEAYAERARSAFFPDISASRPLTTMDAFRRSAQRWPKAADIWLQQLQGIKPAVFDDIFSAVPPHRCTDLSAEFARRILLHNRKIAMTTTDRQ